MKKILLTVSLLAIAVLVLSTTTPALAAEYQKGGPRNGFQGNGRPGAFGTDAPFYREINMDGLLDEFIHNNLAEFLGISTSELEERVDNGETLMDIALSLGFSSDAVDEMMASARADALDQALVDGLLSQAQVDWLSSRGSGFSGFNGTGDCLVD